MLGGQPLVIIMLFCMNKFYVHMDPIFPYLTQNISSIKELFYYMHTSNNSAMKKFPWYFPLQVLSYFFVKVCLAP